MADEEIQEALSEIKAESTGTEQVTEPEQQTIDEIEYTADGKVVKESMDMVKKRASQGYHYAQKMREIKEKEAQYNEAQTRLQELEKWRELDTYARENPQWREHVEQSWQNRDKIGLDPDNPLSGEVGSLRQDISKLSELVQTLQQDKEQRVQQEQDARLSDEIKSIRGEYKDIDFDAADEDGKSLEYRVIEHANTYGLPTFRAAFRDFYHDELIKMRVEQTKQQIAADREKKRKQGLIGESKTPTMANGFDTSVAGKSYEQLLEEALAELK